MKFIIWQIKIDINTNYSWNLVRLVLGYRLKLILVVFSFWGWKLVDLEMIDPDATYVIVMEYVFILFFSVVLNIQFYFFGFFYHDKTDRC